MDNNQLEDVVRKLIAEIQDSLNDRIEKGIVDHVKSTLNAYDFESKINLLTSLKLDNKISSFEIRPVDVEAKLQIAADSIVAGLDKQAKAQILSDIARKIDTVDFQQSITNAVAQQFEARIYRAAWPTNSINFSAIKHSEIAISGDAIDGGIISNFSSTGIDDRATACTVTVLDEHTIVENNLIAASGDIKGDLKLQGDLLIKGVIPSDSLAFKNIVEHVQLDVLAGLNETLFDRYAAVVFDKITANGIDLNQITINGEAAITGNKIGVRITESNLQKLGVVKELQTTGETFLSESLYVSNRRVGVNTIEPSYVLDIWDQEVEIVAGKRSQDTAMFGTVRKQDFIVSSNNKRNLVCTSDGAVAIDHLQIGAVAMISGDSAPSNNLAQGTIVWNSNPVVGAPIGWVSLGSAKWAKFGTIE